MKYRPFLAILLIGFLFAPFLGMQGWMQLRKAAVRKEVKRKLIAGIEKEQLVLLKFSKVEAETKLRWKHSKEFEYDGQLYDVEQTTIAGDSIYYRCWWDNEETHLSKQLNSLTALAFGLDNHRKERQSQFTHFIRTLFYSKPNSWNLLDNQTLAFSEAQNLGYSNHGNSPPVPPPEA